MRVYIKGSKKRIYAKQINQIWRWYIKEQHLEYPSKTTMFALKYIVRYGYYVPEFNYKDDWRGHMDYACDRMNSGRAKAILRLIKESKEINS